MMWCIVVFQCEKTRRITIFLRGINSHSNQSLISRLIEYCRQRTTIGSHSENVCKEE